MNREFMQFMRESHGHLSLKNLKDFIEEKEEAKGIDLNNVYN